MSAERPDARRDPARLVTGQYRDDANLRARLALHEHFGAGPPWHPWVFAKLPAREGLDVLELGCGPARFWEANSEAVPAGWNVTLTDVSPGMLTVARAAMEAAGLEARVLQLEATELERDGRFADGAFDVVLANHMLYHVPDIDAALRGIRRVLRDGGRFFAATNGMHHMEELKRLAIEELPPGTVEPERLAFDLENGEARLRAHFGSLRLHRNADVLRVTDPDAVVAYVASMAGVAGVPSSELAPDLARALETVAARVHTVLAERGAFEVHRVTGLFEAWRGVLPRE
ncbi:MAG: class I SAM-dependent methyltransferase [Deinococcales bacterium]